MNVEEYFYNKIIETLMNLKYNGFKATDIYISQLMLQNIYFIYKNDNIFQTTPKEITKMFDLNVINEDNINEWRIVDKDNIDATRYINR